MKRVYEFVEQQMIRETANLSLPGGIPALHYAAMHGNINAVHLLVQNGANINFRCKEDKNMTALHEAVMAGQTEIAKYLLEHGASQLLRDDSGMGPLHLACKLGHTSIARLLMDHGEGKRALQMLDNVDHKPIDLCSNNFLKSGVENVMRKMHIFVKPRVSLYER
jgi:ankyrin repeat protein